MGLGFQGILKALGGNPAGVILALDPNPAGPTGVRPFQQGDIPRIRLEREPVGNFQISKNTKTGWLIHPTY